MCISRLFYVNLIIGYFLTVAVWAQIPSNAVFHQSHYPAKSHLPFSDCVQVGNLYFLSGQIGMEHSTRTLVVGGIKAETEQTIKNIEEVLQQHNLSLQNVVKCTVILKQIEDFAAFNTIYSKYFTQKPARTTYAASGLAKNARIEIEVIAVKPL